MPENTEDRPTMESLDELVEQLKSKAETLRRLLGCPPEPRKESE